MKSKELISELDEKQMPNLETGYIKTRSVPIRTTLSPHTYEGEVTGFWRNKKGGTACFTSKGATIRLPSDVDVEKI